MQLSQCDESATLGKLGSEAPQEEQFLKLLERRAREQEGVGEADAVAEIDASLGASGTESSSEDWLWVSVYDEEPGDRCGGGYYWNQVSGETAWDLPGTAETTAANEDPAGQDDCEMDFLGGPEAAMYSLTEPTTGGPQPGDASNSFYAVYSTLWRDALTMHEEFLAEAAGAAQDVGEIVNFAANDDTISDGVGDAEATPELEAATDASASNVAPALESAREIGVGSDLEATLDATLDASEIGAGSDSASDLEATLDAFEELVSDGTGEADYFRELGDAMGALTPHEDLPLEEDLPSEVVTVADAVGELRRRFGEVDLTSEWFGGELEAASPAF